MPLAWEKTLRKIDLQDFSLEPEQIEERLGSPEDWVCLIACHIFIDHILTEYLKDILPSPDAYFGGGYRGFGEKLRLCEAHGLFPEGYVQTLHILNSIRNRFAHQLVFEMSDGDKTRLFLAFSPERDVKDVLSAEGFRSFLETLIYYGEIDRLYARRLRRLDWEKQDMVERILNNLRQTGNPTA